MTARRGIAFWIQLAFAALVCAFLILPVGMSILAGVTQNHFVGPSSGLTWRWVVQVWSNYSGTVFLSLQIAFACLVCTLVLGVPLAYVLAKRGGPIARTLEEMLMMPVAVPGIATALGLIVSYGAVPGFRSSWLFILVGHTLFTLPFMVRATLATMSAIDLNTLEEAARALGAGFFRRFFGVVLPNAAPGILAGALMVVTLSLGEFNMTLLLHTPFTRTLPVGLADAYASLRIEVGSAYTLIFLALVVPLLVALQGLAAPRKSKPIVEESK
jgi:putative spermidine/putrescine transport system permease protein